MRKIISLSLVLLSLYNVALGQVPDTIYVYETIIVYDTIIIRDTIRVSKPLKDTIKPDFINIFTSETATFSEQGIILHENNNKNKKVMKLSLVKYLSAVILAAQTTVGLSQETMAPLQKFPTQFSIFYPMSTHGGKTTDYNYNFSFNLLAGKVGGVTGIEFGGLYNRVESSVIGMQFAGLMNRSSEVTGVQFGGLANAANTVAGTQFGGLANIAKNITGIQFAGISNFTDNIKGVQFGGVDNLTKTITGVQFGGITNLAENVKGFQFAGVANISNKVEGFSFGGVLNLTGTLRGIQFGVINVIDTIESGASIALLSIVKKNFYNEWSLTFADYQNVGISYKIGTQKFYTIYTAGSNFIEDELWVFGAGFGSRTALSNKIDFQPEVVTYNYHAIDFKNYNHLWSTHLKLGFVYNINPKLGIAVAPSVYFLSVDKDVQVNYKVSPISNIFSIKDQSSLGVGLSVGLSIR